MAASLNIKGANNQNFQKMREKRKTSTQYMKLEK